jgi:uncharacterized protein YjcR
MPEKAYLLSSPAKATQSRVFEVAERFGISPMEVRQWPAEMFDELTAYDMARAEHAKMNREREKFKQEAAQMKRAMRG